MKESGDVESASALIDKRIRDLGDWRGEMLAKVGGILHEADPEIVGGEIDVCEGGCSAGPLRSF